MDNDTRGSGFNCARYNVGFNGGFWYADCWQLSMFHASGNLYPNLAAAGLELVATCARSEERAQAAAQRWGARHAFDSVAAGSTPRAALPRRTARHRPANPQGRAPSAPRK